MRTLLLLGCSVVLGAGACGGGDFTSAASSTGGSSSGGGGGQSTGGTSTGGSNTAGSQSAGGSAGVGAGGVVTSGSGPGGNAGEGGTGGRAGTGGSGGSFSDPCAGLPHGTACGDEAGFICLEGICEESSCGDSYVDAAGNEDCDDGQNGDNTDGCTDDCSWTCEENEDCSDDNTCNGQERCSNHVCQPGFEVDCGDQNPCTSDACVGNGNCVNTPLGDGGTCGSGLICLSGACDQSRCGDGWVDAGLNESCDDGKNGNNTDGCTDECLWTCETNDDCSDGDQCNGQESCELGTHTCKDSLPLACDDGEPCTANTCDPAIGCEYVFIDNDNDGYSPFTCDPGSTLLGGDCDDQVNAAHPRPSPDTDWFTIPYPDDNFDYNCNSQHEKQYPHACGSPCVGSGWTGNTVPACGETADYSQCTGGGICQTLPRTQGCH